MRNWLLASTAVAMVTVTGAVAQDTQEGALADKVQQLEQENRQQADRIADLERKLDALISQNGTTAAATPAASRPASSNVNAPAANRQAESVPARSASQTATASQVATVPEGPAEPVTVGEAPQENPGQARLELFSDRGGILTPKGQLSVDQSISYSTTTDNRFLFTGTGLAEVLLIGFVDVADTDRTTVSYASTARYGLGRLAVDMTIPVIYSEDRRRLNAVSSTVIPDRLTETYGKGLGDISTGIHYQVTNGGKWPAIIANLRTKIPTGDGPFDVTYVGDNPAEVATGSGYWSLEPSLTFIQQADPAVLFANIGYQANLSQDIDRRIGDAFYRSFDPGDGLRTSFGIGIALNDRVSLNFGYDQTFIFPSETDVRLFVDNPAPGQPEFIDRTVESSDATIGSFLLGYNYRATKRLRLGVSTSFGATDEAPDVNLSLKGQYRF